MKVNRLRRFERGLRFWMIFTTLLRFLMNLHAPSLKLKSNKLDDFSQVRICHKKTNFTRVKQVPDIICRLGSRRSLQLSSFFPGTTLQERSRLISRAAALYRAHIPCKRRTRLPIKIHSFGSEERVAIVIIQLHKVKYK